MFENLLAEIYGQGLLDWVVLITSLVYIYLAARENVWCWVWGIVSCSLWAYAVFTKYDLYVDGFLQLFYVAMGVYGIYAWKFERGENVDLPITRMTLKQHADSGGVVLLSTVFFGYLFSHFTDTSYPHWDSLITSLSVLATVLTVRKKLENWLYWIVADAMAVFLFAAKGAVFFSLVMVVYTIVAGWGYLNWRRRMARPV